MDFCVLVLTRKTPCGNVFVGYLVAWEIVERGFPIRDSYVRLDPNRTDFTHLHHAFAQKYNLPDGFWEDRHNYKVEAFWS